MKKARYIMIGGFLGAGKSTSMARLARFLTDRGLKVGLIVNDQGSELVDATTLKSQGFAVEEITGGCFCCRFDSLIEASRNLSAVDVPDVFLAEPVGSCTDLAATVSYPLRQLYAEDYVVAPLSVVVDPIRARRILGLDFLGRNFSPKVEYIYRKQLEEADVIVINKCDLLNPEQRTELREALERNFPVPEILEVSARTGEGLEAWFARVLQSEMPAGEAMEVDYETYAEGEALLGWLNATVEINSKQPIDGNALLRTMSHSIRRILDQAGAQIAHLKMTLSAGQGALRETGVLSLVRNDYVPETSQFLNSSLMRGDLIINLRAEALPESLRYALETSLTIQWEQGAELRVVHMEAFQPGKPQPTHRMAMVN